MQVRTLSPVTLIRRKQQAGFALTSDERQVLAEYHSKYNRQKKGIHLKAERAKLWVELAERQGLSLSAWIQERVDEALFGHDEDLKALREELQRVRDENVGLRGTSGQLAVENSKLRTRMETMEPKIIRLTEKLLDLEQAL